MVKIIKWLCISIGILLCLLLILGFWILKIEPGMLIVKHEVLYLPNWNQKLNGIKVVLLADLHIGCKNTKIKDLKKIVKVTNEQKPDFIFLLGDFDPETVIIHAINQDEIAKVLGELKASYGIMAVLGNHDIKNNLLIRDILKKSNIPLLEDTNIKVTYNKQSFYVAGLKDYWHFVNDIDGAMGGSGHKLPVLLLSHNPDVFPEVPSQPSLTVSGHTHGGVIVIPFIGGLFSPSKYFQRYLKGHIVEDGKHLYVSSGIKRSFSFNNSPEIVVLTLNSQNEKTKIMNTSKIKGINKSYINDYFKIKKALGQ